MTEEVKTKNSSSSLESNAETGDSSLYQQLCNRASKLNYKSVNDLIKDRVTIANKLREEFEKSEEYSRIEATRSTKEEQTSLHPYYNSVVGFENPLNPWANSKFYEDRDTLEDDDSMSLMGYDRLRDLIREKMDLSTEISASSLLSRSNQDQKLPAGFDNIKEDEKGPYFNEILEFLSPFLDDTFDDCKNGEGTLQKVLYRMTEHFETYSSQKEKLMQVMNVKKFIVPYITLDLPGDIILAYNKMDDTDPLVSVFRLHPIIGEEVCKFGIFLDRYDTHKEVICSLVWSTIDNMVISLPMVGLNPYPRCWTCEKKFGTLTCSKCGVAKYCSKQCQVESWKRAHRFRCREIEHYASQHKSLVFT